VETFTMRLSTILSDLEMLGDLEDEPKAVRNSCASSHVSTVRCSPKKVSSDGIID
jgi:hypothetical protein